MKFEDRLPGKAPRKRLNNSNKKNKNKTNNNNNNLIIIIIVGNYLLTLNCFNSKSPVIRATFFFNLQKRCCTYYHPLQTLSRNKILLLQVKAACCIKLNWTFFNKVFQLATTYFVAWQCLRRVVIRPTTLSNLQRNNVEVAAICCSYYFTLTCKL